MRDANGLGRLGGLAVGLGIGAALAATAGTASADPSSPQVPDLVADVSPLLVGDAAAVAADPSAALDPGMAPASSLFNIAISANGVLLLQLGSATATSSTGTFGFALGANSDAIANTFGNGTNDYAFAVGDNSTASANSDTGNWAIGLLDGSTAKASGGANDFAFAAGDNATAEAGDFGGTVANDDTSLALGTGTQGYAGVFPSFDLGAATVGNNDEADVFGDGSIGVAGDNGDNDTAAILGDGSTADAGFGASDTSLNNDDLAAVLGDALTAMATSGSGLTDVVP